MTDTNKVELEFTVKNTNPEAMKNIQTDLEGTKEKSEGLKGSMGELSEVWKKFTELLEGYLVLEVGKEFINTASAMENYKAQLSALEGSQEKGNELFEKLHGIIEETPLQMQDLVKAYQRLQAEQQKTIDWNKNLQTSLGAMLHEMDNKGKSPQQIEKNNESEMDDKIRVAAKSATLKTSLKDVEITKLQIDEAKSLLSGITDQAAKRDYINTLMKLGNILSEKSQEYAKKEGDIIKANLETYNEWINKPKLAVSDIQTKIDKLTKDCASIELKIKTDEAEKKLDNINDKIKALGGGNANIGDLPSKTNKNEAETHATGGMVTGNKGIVGHGEFVINKAATANIGPDLLSRINNQNIGTDLLSRINNFHIPALPQWQSSINPTGGKEGGGIINSNSYILNLQLPNQKTYPMKTKEDVFKELINDFNNYQSGNSSPVSLEDYMKKKHSNY
jgi:hypothetical protein